MKTGCKRALVISAPAPNYLSTITISTAKIINAMLKDGWQVDIIGLRENSQDCELSSLVNGAELFLGNSLFNKPSTWAVYAINTGEKLINYKHYDIMISFAQYTWTHVAAYYLRKKHNIPWVVFFSDPWGNNPDLNIRPLRRYMELKVLLACNAIVYPNHLLKDWALSQFPVQRELFEEKSFIVPYFYDSNLFPKTDTASGNGKIVFRHMGQIPVGGYILSLLHGIKMLKDEGDYLKNKLLFEFYGRVNSSYKGSVEKLVVNLGLKKNVFFSSKSNRIIHMPYNESLKLMKESNALLLLGIHPSFYNGWGNTVLHVKLVDYIGANKPIFALAGKNSITHQIFSDNNGFCSDDDPIVIKEALKRFIADPQIVSNTTRERFSIDNVYPLWQEVFRKVTGNA